MHQAGFVSLWIGKASTQAELDEYIRLGYTDDGELSPSQFMVDFELPRWDDSCREAVCYEDETTAVRELLSGFSYDDQIIPQFEQQVGPMFKKAADAIVLLYNFNYRPASATASCGPVSLHFIGIAEYHL